MAQNRKGYCHKGIAMVAIGSKPNGGNHRQKTVKEKKLRAKERDY